MGILDGIKGDGEVVVEKQIAVKRNLLEEKIDRVMQRYEEWLAQHQTARFPEFGNACRQLGDSIVDQSVIDEFCLRMKDYQEAYKFECSGFFLSAMVQNAYKQGHNDLRIDTQEIEYDIDFIAANLRGKEGDMIRVTIDGDGGRHCGYDTRHSRLIFNGNVGDYAGLDAKLSVLTVKDKTGDACGIGAKNSGFTLEEVGNSCACRAVSSIFTFNGKVDFNCGMEAEDSRFIFNSDAASGCGQAAKDSHLTFMGEAGPYCGSAADNSRFYSPKIETLKTIKRLTQYSCSFYLIESDGTSKEVLR